MKERHLFLNRTQKIITLFIFICGVAAGQNSTVFFDANFHTIGSKKISANQLILLKGEGANNISDLKVFSTTASSARQEFKGVQIKDNSWSVLVGPFLPKQNILIEFDFLRKMDQKESDAIKNQALESAQNAFFLLPYRIPPSVSTDKLISTLQQLLDSSLSPVLKNYKDKNGISLQESLINIITRNNEDVLKFINDSLNNLKDKKEELDLKLTNFLTILKKDTSSSGKSDAQIYTTLKGLKDSQLNFAQKILSGIKNDTWREAIKNQINVIIKAENDITAKINSVLAESELFKSAVVYINDLGSDNLNTGISNYVGVDIMPASYDKNRPGTFGLFLSFSPYFGRIDPEEPLIDRDPSGSKESGGKHFLNNLKKIVTPTVGLGLVNSPTDSTLHKFMVFAGFSMRINNLVRFSVGKTFYATKSEPRKLMSAWTYGICLDIEHLADVLKIVSTTTKQLNL